MFKKIDLKIPKHLGIILDGNGRWASRRGLSRNLGHKEGVKAISKTVLAAKKIGIKYLSVFAFSTENWKRSKDEVDGIFALIKDFFVNNLQKVIDEGIKINFFGDLSVFDEELKQIFDEVIRKTKNNSSINFNICLNYGGKDDIVYAVNKLIKKGKKDITSKDISENLYSAGQPDLDFVIRTSGECRISNFMLYQMSYAELYFPKILWPDFNEKELRKCLLEFSKRKRRFGGY